MPTFMLGDLQINYRILRGKSRRYSYLRFQPDLTLEIISPAEGNPRLDALLRKNVDWIRKKYEEMSLAYRVLTEEGVLFEGRRLRIVFVPSLEEEGLKVDFDRREVVLKAQDRSRIRELVRRWFLAESSSYAVSRLPVLAARLGVRFKRADVREIRNWGYCTKSGRITVSWQLAALPERLREYVLLHELVHLSEFNHSPAFRRRLKSVCPDYRQREKELERVEGVGPVE